MNKLSREKREKLLLIALFSIGISAVLYFVVMAGQKETLADLAAKHSTRQSKLDSAKRIIDRTQKFNADLEEQRKILIAKQADMPRPDQDELWFHEIMEKRRAEFNLNTEQIWNKEVASAGVLPNFPFKAIAIKVDVSGTYHDFGRFLADFENDYPYMRVELLRVWPELKERRPVDRATGAAAPEPIEISALPAPPPGEGRLRFLFRVIALLKTPT